MTLIIWVSPQVRSATLSWVTQKSAILQTGASRWTLAGDWSVKSCFLIYEGIDKWQNLLPHFPKTGSDMIVFHSTGWQASKATKKLACWHLWWCPLVLWPLPHSCGVPSRLFPLRCFRAVLLIHSGISSNSEPSITEYNVCISSLKSKYLFNIPL